MKQDNDQLGYKQQGGKIEVFTDGACLGNPGKGGWAARIKLNGQCQWREIYGCEKLTTNNRMELTAAIKAIESLGENCENMLVVISSDSQYLVKGMNAWIVDWQKRGWRTAAKKPVQNLDLWQKLLQLSLKLNPKPQFLWVKGHEGNIENEKVDIIAKKAALNA